MPRGLIWRFVMLTSVRSASGAEARLLREVWPSGSVEWRWWSAMRQRQSTERLDPARGKRLV